ncbi:MAG: hypothetical protein OCD02_09340 [Spirochaetaceae bacterium]
MIKIILFIFCLVLSSNFIHAYDDFFYTSYDDKVINIFKLKEDKNDSSQFTDKLYKAIKSDNEYEVYKLIQRGGDPNYEIEYSNYRGLYIYKLPILLYAVEKKDYKLAQLLLDKGADPMTSYKYEYEDSNLTVFSRVLEMDNVRFISMFYTKNIWKNQLDLFSKIQSTITLQVFINDGLKIINSDNENKKSNTLNYISESKKSHNLISHFIKNTDLSKVHINNLLIKGITSDLLVYAIKNGIKYEIDSETYFYFGGKWRKETISPFKLAVRLGKLEVLLEAELKSKVMFKKEYATNNSLLHTALLDKDYQDAKNLIISGIDLTIRNSYGDTIFDYIFSEIVPDNIKIDLFKAMSIYDILLYELQNETIDGFSSLINKIYSEDTIISAYEQIQNNEKLPLKTRDNASFNIEMYALW